MDYKKETLLSIAVVCATVGGGMISSGEYVTGGILCAGAVVVIFLRGIYKKYLGNK